MYKLIGCLLLIFSIIIFFYRKCAVFYCTYQYLGYILELLEDMKIACIYGKTYTSVFHNYEIETEKDLFFKICLALCSQEQKNETDTIILNAGKRIKAEEEQYLEYNKQLLKDKYAEYVLKFKENNKISLMTGVYTAAVIILVVV